MMSCKSAADEIIQLEKVAAIHGFPGPSLSGTTAVIKNQYNTILFSKDSRKIIANGTLIWMNCPAIQVKGKWNIASIDAETIIGALLTSQAGVTGKECWTIVLDPGHGGKSIGAISARKVYEKKAVMDIARKTKALLPAKNLSVRMTRDGDYTMDLAARTEKALKSGADIFVSIHLNFAGNSNAKGIETYILSCRGFPSTVAGKPEDTAYPGNRYDRANMILAYNVHRAVLKATGADDRGIKHARFNVIRDAPCPAILIECGFLSNATEESLIINPEYRDKIAGGIASGITEYLKQSSQ